MRTQEYSALLLTCIRALDPPAARTWLDKHFHKSFARDFFRIPDGSGFTCMRCRRHRDGLRAMQRHVAQRNCSPRRTVGDR